MELFEEILPSVSFGQYIEEDSIDLLIISFSLLLAVINLWSRSVYKDLHNNSTTSW